VNILIPNIVLLRKVMIVRNPSPVWRSWRVATPALCRLACIALAAALAGTLPVPVEAQELPEQPVAEKKTVHSDFRTPGPWFLIAYHTPAVGHSRSGNSDRLSELIVNGKLYLSLQDAIDLAVENSFDVELQRFDHEFARTEVERAEGGGLLRGIPTTVSELPAGEGGPGEPLLTTVGGYSPVLQLPSSAGSLATISPTSEDLSITGGTALSSGPAVPQFDPVLSSQFAVAQATQLSASSMTTGSNIEHSHSVLFNLGYQQGFSPGTQVNATFQSDSTNENSTTNNLNPSTNGYFNVSVVQPLLQGFGIRLNRRFIRIAKNEDAIADYVFRQQLISTVSDVIRLYWDFVSLSADLQVKKGSLDTAQRLYQDTKNQVDQGTQAPLQLTSAQAQLESSRGDYINSQGLVLQQELLLKEVLTRKGISDPALANAGIEALTPIATPESETLEPLPEFLQDATRNRPDLLLAHVQLENIKISLQGSRNELLPQLNLVGTVQNNGLAGMSNAGASSATIPASAALMGGYGSFLSQVFSRDYPGYSIGLELDLPLRNRVARADATRDELQSRQTDVRLAQLDSQVRLQVGNAWIAVQQAKTAYQAAVEARKLQEQALNVEQARFDAGVDTAYVLIQYQRDLAQGRSAELTALGVYAKAKTALERAVGLTLQNNGVSIEEAYQGQLSRSPSKPPQ